MPAGEGHVHVLVEQILAGQAVGAVGVGRGGDVGQSQALVLSPLGDLANDLIDPAVGAESQRVEVESLGVAGPRVVVVLDALVAACQSKLKLRVGIVDRDGLEERGDRVGVPALRLGDHALFARVLPLAALLGRQAGLVQGGERRAVPQIRPDRA